MTIRICFGWAVTFHWTLLRRGAFHGLFVAAENPFNNRYETGKTPVTTIGPPILVRVGFRVHLGSR
jgi:hypothetical protein